MLDPDEMAAYEAWKMHKMTASTDLSVAAFNLESEATALAWEDGWHAHHIEIEKQKNDPTYAITKHNPHRDKGMSGYLPSKKVTS